MQTSKFAVFRTVCEIYLTNSSEPYIKLKPLNKTLIYVWSGEDENPKTGFG